MPRRRTKVTFRDSAASLSSSKEAYIWLVQKFCTVRPGLLDFEAEKPYIKTGYGRRRFAKRPEALYEKSSHLTDLEDHWVKLPGGWFADVHNDNRVKLEVLNGLSRAAGLIAGQDWTWDAGPKPFHPHA